MGAGDHLGAVEAIRLVRELLAESPPEEEDDDDDDDDDEEEGVGKNEHISSQHPSARFGVFVTKIANGGIPMSASCFRLESLPSLVMEA